MYEMHQDLNAIIIEMQGGIMHANRYEKLECRIEDKSGNCNHNMIILRGKYVQKREEMGPGFHNK